VPLSGITVLDLSRLLPGGFCSLLLADYGADVIKVEDTGAGDYLRWMEPRVATSEPSTANPSYVALNRNKRSVCLDLKQPAGRDALIRLAARADVLIESFRPGVMDRLGVGYATLAAHNPRLVHCAVTGYGQSGPDRDRAGHDLDYLAATGVLALGGAADGGPAMAGVQIADLGGGALMAAFAVMAALREREASGRGQFVDVSMAHGALSFLVLAAPDALATGRPVRRDAGLLNGGIVCYRVYACADGWVALGALEPKFWSAWCHGVGREDLVAHQFDGPDSPAADAVAAVFATRTRAEWEAFNAEHDCCVQAVAELEEALASPLVRERGMVVEATQPGAEAPVAMLGAPVGMSRTPADELRRHAPALGEHTREVLVEAGLDGAEIDELLAAGAARAAA